MAIPETVKPTHSDLVAVGDQIDGQLCMEFTQSAYPVQIDNRGDMPKQTFQELMAEITAMSQKYADILAANIEKDGHKIFHVKTENDDDSVETDYGAPAIGLDFFRSVIKPRRSFRYAKVRTIEGNMRTHHEQAQAVGEFFHDNGYHIFSDLKPDQYASQVHFMNGGVTRAFSDTIRYLIKEHQKIAPMRELIGPKETGAIIVPVPTYGLFLYILDELTEGTDIQVIGVHRHDDGSVDQHSLELTLQKCRLQNIRPLAYYDCNPHNPTGHIRTEAETRAVAKIIMDDARDRIAGEIIAMEAVMKEDEKKLPTALVMHSEKPQVGTILIDDMAYEDLEHVDKKPFSFAQVSKETANHTVTLKGVSKIGLPGARIGLMVAHPDLIEAMVDGQLVHEFTASSIGVDIITARYSHNKQRKMFLRHYDRLRKAHRTKMGVIEAFINGIDRTDKLNMFQKQKLIHDYASRFKLSYKTARTRLKTGLPNFRIPKETEAGFFMNLHAQSLYGHVLAAKTDNHMMPEARYITTSPMLHKAFKAFGIETVSAWGQGASPYSLQGRITISVRKDELLDFYDRLRTMHNYFFGPNPQVQLDLFNNNPAALKF